MGITPNDQAADQITWTAGGGNSYSAGSAYKYQFLAAPTSGHKEEIWKTWVPGSVKNFAWLMHHNRLWCNDRLQRRGWPNGYFCPLCMRNLETSSHLMWSCPFSRLVWQKASSWTGCAAFIFPDTTIVNSIQHCKEIISKTPAIFKKGLKAMLMMICQEIWKERNVCVFRSKMPKVDDVIHSVRQNLEQWRLAGAICLEPPFGETSAR